MIREAQAAILAALITACACGVGTFFYGVNKYAAGVKADRQRSDGVILKLHKEHAEALLAANAQVAATEELWRMKLQGAQRAQEKERSANERMLAAVAADRNSLREQLANAAAGGVEASNDTVAACRERAAAFGRVLDDALQAHAVCTAAAEDNAAGVRTLLSGWPEQSR